MNVMNIRNKIECYFELAEDIHDYFGYEEDWVSIPMDSRLGDYWMVIGEGAGGLYVHSREPFTKEVIEAGKEIYSGAIYTQRFLPKWVYRGEELTMICCDTRTDGNKLLTIFENDKECKDEELKQAYMDKWGSM